MGYTGNMYSWIANTDDIDLLRQKMTECKDTLDNPFATLWGLEFAQYVLWDVKERLAQLGAAV
jgi:hypothetical protein